MNLEFKNFLITEKFNAEIERKEAYEEIEEAELLGEHCHEEEEQDLFHADDEADNEINKELYEKEMAKE